MDLNARKEQFSRAYVHAVAAVAGYAWSQPSVDDDSVDLTLSARGGGGTVRSPKVDLQVKCHAAAIPATENIRYALPVKNYNELRDDSVQVARILVLVLVPDDPANWLTYTEAELALRRSGYWVSLRGWPATLNTATIQVAVPRHQAFHPETLRSIMLRIGAGGVP